MRAFGSTQSSNGLFVTHVQLFKKGKVIHAYDALALCYESFVSALIHEAAARRLVAAFS